MNEHHPTILNPSMECDIGARARWGRNVTFGPHCKRVRLGFGAFIGNDCYIDVEDLEVGDYFTLHHGSVLHGQTCRIGHNNWVGQYTILDALGSRLQIGDNVGVGAHSQLWTHMKFGDRLAGCRWYRNGSLEIGDDAWLVGHCIVATERIAPRAMLLVGGVATRDLEENRVYAGSPAKDVSSKLGGQFEEVSAAQRAEVFAGYLEEFAATGARTDFVQVVEGPEELTGADEGVTPFCLEARRYRPRYTDDEHALMRFLLYDRAKFVPVLGGEG